ncbi:MAG: carbonic anhydrase [Alphaproteobacteria bacterium]|nr:carbonic anhydrase [Alphaproteobacteria bacterium]
MSVINEFLEFNKKFVAENKAEPYAHSVIPEKKLAILTCMDARLVKLLPAAIGLKNGDAKVIKNAGAVITSPFGSVMRSLLIAVYKLGVEEIMVVGHYDCGVLGMCSDKILPDMEKRGITKDKLDLCAAVAGTEWLKGFDKVEDSVADTVKIIRNHPLMPAEIKVHGFVICPDTGRLDPVK